MRRYSLLAATALLFVIISGCGKQPLISHANVEEYPNRVVAAFGDDYSLTLPAFYDSLETREWLARSGGIVDIETQEAVLDSILLDTLLWVEALNVDITSDYRTRRLATRRYEEVLIRSFYDEYIMDKISVDSETVVEFYHDNDDMFKRDEQILAWHILVTVMGAKRSQDSLRFKDLYGPELEQAVKDYVYEISAVADSAESFDELALRYSNDNTVRSDHGLIGWVTRGEYQPPFDSVAFALQPGETSGPYFDANGWHIIHVSDRVDGGLPPFDTLTFQVATRTYLTMKANETARGILDSLQGLVELEFNEPVLDSNAFLLPGSTWVAVVRGRDTLRMDDIRTMEEGYRQAYNVPNSDARMKKEMCQRMAPRLLVIQMARDVGVPDYPEVEKARRRIFQEHGRDWLLKGMRDPEWEPSNSMVAQYYRDHEEEFVVKRPLVVQQIIVEDSVMGEFLRDQALSGVDFLDLADEYYPGEPSMRRELADLGAISQDEVSEEFWDAAGMIQIGGVSHPIKTDLGYQVIKVVDRKKSRDLAEASLYIKERLRKAHNRQVYENFRDKLFKQYEVRYPSRLTPVHLRPRELRIEQTADVDGSN